jgi:predicted N-acetyltransferase YhbS
VALGPPHALSNSHDLGDFDCGEATLNDWLFRRALANQLSGATRTFVACEDNRIVAYYALAAGAVAALTTSGRFRRNMPEPIPVAVLARLAVDRAWSGRGLGRALVRDSARRVLEAAQSIGIRGVLVQAISDDAKDFYIRVGFSPSPLEPLTLMATLADLRAGMLPTATH